MIRKKKMQNNKKPIRGFSLIEVMVALAILVSAVGSLLIVRNNAIKEASMAVEARKLKRLLEQQMGKIAMGIEKNSSGNFRDVGLPDYRWRSEIEDEILRSKDKNGKEYRIVLKKVTLVVSREGNRLEKQCLECYLPAKKTEK